MRSAIIVVVRISGWRVVSAIIVPRIVGGQIRIIIVARVVSWGVVRLVVGFRPNAGSVSRFGGCFDVIIRSVVGLRKSGIFWIFFFFFAD